MSEKELTHAEMVRNGGRKRFELAGSEGMSEMGKKGNAAMRELGDEFFKKRAKKIAESRKRNRKLKKQKESSVGKLISTLTGK